MPKVLIVEDDARVGAMLQSVLGARGYQVVSVRTGAEARRLVQADAPALILVDHILPDVDGLVLMSLLRAATQAPIIICTEGGLELERTLALNLGAADVVSKPLDAGDLERRVSAALHSSTTTPERVSINQLVIDQAHYRVTIRNRLVALTATEYRLLVLLATHASETLSTASISQALWGYDDASSGHLVHVHVGRLRRKLGPPQDGAPIIASIRRQGYRLQNEA